LTSPDDAYLRLRDLIYSGELMPNERLVEADLAQRLQAGRAIVRTALVRLGQDGVVTLTPHRGARVRVVTDAEAVEILQTRAVLEALTAREAARRASAKEIAAIRRILGGMSRRLEEGDLPSTRRSSRPSRPATRRRPRRPCGSISARSNRRCPTPPAAS